LFLNVFTKIATSAFQKFFKLYSNKVKKSTFFCPNREKLFAYHHQDFSRFKMMKLVVACGCSVPVGNGEPLRSAVGWGSIIHCALLIAESTVLGLWSFILYLRLVRKEYKSDQVVNS
jgi:hypothetical protein